MLILIRVEMAYFVAGVEAKGERITRAAPILARWLGKSPKQLERWVKSNGGSISVVSRYPEEIDDRG